MGKGPAAAVLLLIVPTWEVLGYEVPAFARQAAVPCVM
jgi:hypothetical protein